ncbi:MAG: hypothetical protein HOM21_12290 [Halobacteriovoraceae bacterium]|nr:hypothetical protein [Halobacteriovoraceae bacterium]
MLRRLLQRMWVEPTMLFSMLALLTTLFLAENALSKEVAILEMTNDEDSEIAQLVLDLDDTTKDIQNFIKITLKKDRSVKARVSYDPYKSLEAGGLVLEKRKGRVIIALKSDNYSNHNGGDIVLDTLYDGVKDKRKSYQYQLGRLGDGWEVQTDGVAIYKMHMKSKKRFLIGTVGIKDIITAPKGE